MKQSCGQRYKRCTLMCECGFSALFIIISCLVVTVTVFAGIITIKHVLYNYTPSAKAVDRLLSKGKLEEAQALIYKAKEHSAAVNIIKAKVHIALSLQEHTNNQWQKFGVNPGDWLDDDNSKIAVDLLREAILWDPSSSLAHSLLGVVLKEMGKLEEAEQVLHTARNLDPSSVDSYLALSSLFVLESRYSEAEDMLRAASKIHPKNPYVMKNMGFLYRFYVNKPESSIVWLNRFLSYTDPTDSDIGLAKSEFRELAQRYPEVIVDTTPWGSKRNFTARTNTPFK